MPHYFASNLTYYRVAAGLTMTALARLSRVAQPNIGRYERGETLEPKRPALEAIAAVLGVTPERLLHEPPPEVLPPGTVPWPRKITVADATPPATVDAKAWEARMARVLEWLTEFYDGRPTPAPELPPRPKLYPRDARILHFLGRFGADPAGGEPWLDREAATDRYVLEAIGDCLEPDVEDHDLLVMEVDRQPKTGDIVALAVHGELHLKQVMQRTETGLYLTSRRGDLTLPEEGAEVLGVIVRFTHDKPPRSRSMSTLGVGPTHGWRVAVGDDDD